MSELKDARIWGGVGAILTLVGLGLIGFVLKLIGVKKIADATGNDEIFKKYLYSAILAVVGSALIAVSVFPLVMTGNMYHNVYHTYTLIGLAGTTLIVSIVLLIVAFVFMIQSYKLIAEETGVKMFSTVAKLYIIGAVLLVVVVGVFILLIASILEVVAFFSLPDELPRPSPYVETV